MHLEAAANGSPYALLSTLRSSSYPPHPLPRITKRCLSRCVVELKGRKGEVRLVGCRGRRAEPAVLLRKAELMLRCVKKSSGKVRRRRRSGDRVSLGLALDE